MSCNCNNNLQQNKGGNNCIQPFPQCNFCPYRGCGCNGCNRRDGDKKDNCKHRKEKHDSESDRKQKKEKRNESDDDCGNKKEKHCDKCRRHKCECIEYVSCFKTKCGFISASLAKTVSPTFFTAAGQIITYTYTITNTGNVPICDAIRICDDRLGGQIIPGSFILPGASQAFTRTYTTIASDLLAPSITNTAVAYIEVDCRKWVVTNQSSATVTYGSADLFGTISQTLVTGSTGTVEVTVTVSNSALSASAAQNVSLTLPFPANISGVVAGVPPPTSINANNVVFSVPSLDIGASASFRFQYIAGSIASGASYAFLGTIVSSTFDPNPSNNTISSTFVFP